MPNRSSKRPKRPRDPNALAFQIVQEATGNAPQAAPPTPKTPEQQAAALLGRRGGLKGGPARRKALSAKRRTEIARKAAKARWSRGDRRG